jgi:hypothetical protein
VFGALLGWFSFLYHGLLGLFLLLVAALALGSAATLHLDMVPWHAADSPGVLLLIAIVALGVVALAIARRARFLLLVWSAIVVIALLKGYVFSKYRFETRAGLHTAEWLIAGALVALAGAAFALRRASRTAV